VGVDEPLLHRLNQETFADHWGFTPTPYGEWLHWLMEMGDADPSLWFVAEVARKPAGLCVCQPFEWGEPDCGWVSTLGVLPAFRGRGLGTSLLEHSLAAFQARGLARAGLGVDAENTTGAVRLYERVGMRVSERQDLWELRP
jgi:ribosomal protein S18 acetylase RimI-like enzyme